MCTGPDTPLQRVLRAYLWRWDIEVNFRDQNVGQTQVRNPQAVQRVPATAVAAYALLLLAAVQTFGPTGSPHTLPPPAWRRHERPQRAATVQLINHLRWELWGQAIASAGLPHFRHPQPATHKCPKPKPTPATSLFYSLTG